MRGQAVDAELEQLMNAPGRTLGQAEDFEYDTAPARERLWRADWDAPLETIATQRRDPNNVSVCRRSRGVPAEICMQWIDGGPGVVPMGLGPWVELAVHPNGATVRVQAEPLVTAPPNPIGRCLQPVDDRSYYFFTRVVGPEGDAYRWATLFRPSPELWERLPPGKLELRVRGHELEPVLSKAFTKDGKPLRLCSHEEMRGVCGVP